MCEDVEIKKTEITCLPPHAEPQDVTDYPRVRVRKLFSRTLNIHSWVVGRNNILSVNVEALFYSS